MNSINRLYIHIPFCRKKCSYCAFHSIPISKYSVEVFLKKLEQNIHIKKYLASPLDSIFIGGGTPSLLNNKDLENLFSLIRNNFIIKEDAEITIENNPETLTEEKIGIISSFANRISIGIQSFNNNHRSIIGRNGSIKNINSIIGSLIKNNIDNISIDLIYGIPTQTVKDWELELQEALKLPIKHLSAYSLTYEEGTSLNKEKIKQDLIEADTVSSEMWQLTPEILSLNNLSRYEISNYSMHGSECKHNLDTWLGGRYLGFGPTASSFDGEQRWTNTQLQQWLKDTPPEQDILSPYNRTLEIFIMGFRTVKGWSIISNKYDKSVVLKSPFPHDLSFNSYEWGKIFNKLEYLSNTGLLNIKPLDTNETHISPTSKGLLFWDEIALELLD